MHYERSSNDHPRALTRLLREPFSIVASVDCDQRTIPSARGGQVITACNRCWNWHRLHRPHLGCAVQCTDLHVPISRYSARSDVIATLAPIAIAEGPLPPNEADILHAEDVLRFCASRRSRLLDQLNLLQLFLDSPSKFDFSNGASENQIRQANVDTQSDLDLIAACASAAINHPGSALMPTDFGSKQDPQIVFPKAVMPDPLPGPKHSPAGKPPAERRAGLR